MLKTHDKKLKEGERGRDREGERQGDSKKTLSERTKVNMKRETISNLAKFKFLFNFLR